MQSAVAVAVGAFVLFCLLRHVDSGNLTTASAADELQKNNPAVGIQLKLIKHKPLREQEALPPTDAAAAEASEELSIVRGKWESGNPTVMAVQLLLPC